MGGVYRIQDPPDPRRLTPTGVRTRYLGRPRAMVRTTRPLGQDTPIASNSLLEREERRGICVSPSTIAYNLHGHGPSVTEVNHVIKVCQGHQHVVLANSYKISLHLICSRSVQVPPTHLARVITV